MKKFALVASLLCMSTAALADGNQPIMKCQFLESMSVSFGYSSVYTIEGTITDAGIEGLHFYEVNAPVSVAVDTTPSTNFPGKHLGDTTGKLDNHPWGNRVLIDLASKETSGPASFRILVFTGPSTTGATPVFSAYKMAGMNGAGLAGTCMLDPRLQTN